MWRIRIADLVRYVVKIIPANMRPMIVVVLQNTILTARTMKATMERRVAGTTGGALPSEARENVPRVVGSFMAKLVPVFANNSAERSRIVS